MFELNWMTVLIVLFSAFMSHWGWRFGSQVETSCCSMVGVVCGAIMACTVLLIALEPNRFYEYENLALVFWPVLSLWIAFVIRALLIILRWFGGEHDEDFEICD